MDESNFLIRPGHKADIPRILELEEKNWPPGRRVDRDEFEKRMETFSEGFLVMENNESHIIGISTAFLLSEKPTVHQINVTPSKTTLHNEKGTRYYLHAIAIDEHYRGKGLGRMLVSEHEKNAARFGCASVHLIAAESEEPFYVKLGYSRISEYKPYKDIEMAEFEKILTSK